MTFRTGVHGEKVSLLGYGAMRLPTVDGRPATNNRAGSSGAAIDMKTLDGHVDFMLAKGVNYFDTSPVYCRGASEDAIGRSLSRHPRDSYFIATKLSNFNPKFWPLDKCRKMFADSLKNLRTDHIDFYLLHAIGNDGFNTFRKRYIDNGALDWLLSLRASGAIRNLGFSFHGDRRAFDWCVERHSEFRWDFCQIQMNYVDWRHAAVVNKRNVDAECLYGALAGKGIPAIVMEPLLGGRLAKFDYAVSEKLKKLGPGRTPASWAFRFCGTHPGVLTVLSGMTYMENIRENVATFSPLEPLGRGELDALEDVARLILGGKTVPCNLCQYCMPCPYGIDIPGVFGCWNEACVEDRLPDGPEDARHAADRRRFLDAYDGRIPDLRQAEHCIGCARCVSHCPQSIDIPAKMAEIDAKVAAWRKEERHV